MSDLFQTATPASAHAKVSRRWMSGRYSQDVVVALVCYAVLFAAVIVIFFAAAFAAMGVAPAKGATVVKPKASFVLNGALHGSLKSQAAVCSIIKRNHLVTVSFDGLKLSSSEGDLWAFTADAKGNGTWTVAAPGKQPSFRLEDYHLFWSATAGSFTFRDHGRKGSAKLTLTGTAVNGKVGVSTLSGSWNCG